MNEVPIKDGRIFIVCEDPRYQTLVIEQDGQNKGYAIEEGTLRRVCICAAHSSYECCCGAWDKDA